MYAWARIIERRLRKLGVIIDDVDMMTYILPNLPEEYEKII